MLPPASVRKFLGYLFPGFLLISQVWVIACSTVPTFLPTQGSRPPFQDTKVFVKQKLLYWTQLSPLPRSNPTNLFEQKKKEKVNLRFNRIILNFWVKIGQLIFKYPFGQNERLYLTAFNHRGRVELSYNSNDGTLLTSVFTTIST